MAQVTSDGTTIDYDDLGAGSPALLLMPDWCASRMAFLPLLKRLSAHRRVLSLDWRGHGASGVVKGDFGEEDLVADVLAVMEASGATSVIPVSLAQAGWVGIELRRRLGPAVPGLVFIDWIISEAPPAFLYALEDMRSDDDWRQAVDGMIAHWRAGVDDADLLAFLSAMSAMPAEMWDRAAREIESSYARYGTPLHALDRLEPSPPVLHLFADSADANAAATQAAYAAEHHWYHAAALPARTHFPMFEAPQRTADEIERFAARVGGRRRSRRAA